MKKISGIILGFLVFCGFIFFPFQISAKQAKVEDKDNLRILVHYQAIPKKCNITRNDQVSNFGWGGWKLQSGITNYRINYSSKPSSLSNSKVKTAIEKGFVALQGAGGGILFHYAGDSSKTNASNDGENTILWRTLPSGIVGLTYIWTDGNGRLADADTVFNKRYSWNYTSYNGSNDCGGAASSFDLQDIATHEFGHWMGLGDLYDANSKDLTMYGYAARGELKKDTLGLGDINGIRAVWP
ncbi:MAG: hypothetical protein M1429_01295 [Patescibacteria group bacterium]|nr:hypothetical protein [Patescibacteria group bacterium]